MPKISIGLPVFNGENYVDEAITSVLEQTASDLELVISDNASTDRTAEICQEHAARDSRVRYYRNERNLGAAPNYNIVFEHCTGEYFKWIQHDERLLPRYLEATVEALEADPGAVLANTTTEYIDVDASHLGYYRSVLANAQAERPAERFAPLILRSHTCIDFFGLLRRAAMQNSLLHQSFSGADKAFLAQMALRGRMLQLDEPLVQMREHPDRYTRKANSARLKLAWHDASLAGRIDVPTWTLYRTYSRLLETEALEDRDRAECRAILRRFWVTSWNGARLAADLVSIPFPRAVDIAFKIKFKLFGAPGNFLERS